MLVYQDLISGDELLSDFHHHEEIENGMLWEVEGKWVTNPSVEVGGEDEGVDNQAVKVLDIVDAYRLQEQPPLDKKQFMAFVRRYIKNMISILDEEKKFLFQRHMESAIKFLVSKLEDLIFFSGESMHDDGSLVFAYYKEGATNPTFLYFAYGLKEIQC